jgi:hypothetical protein
MFNCLNFKILVENTLWHYLKFTSATNQKTLKNKTPTNKLYVDLHKRPTSNGSCTVQTHKSTACIILYLTFLQL